MDALLEKRGLETIEPTPGQTQPPPRKFFSLSPINRRRWQNFKANRRGYWSLWIFLGLFVISLFAEFIANDRPMLIYYKGEVMSPVLNDYPPSTFGGALATINYRSARVQREIEENGWMLWPPIRYSDRSSNGMVGMQYPAPPWWLISAEQRCERLSGGVENTACTLGNWNWLGTDDGGRDVLARIIYGFRISVLFGLTLAILSSVVGVIAGAVQGYF